MFCQMIAPDSAYDWGVSAHANASVSEISKVVMENLVEAKAEFEVWYVLGIHQSSRTMN